MIDPQYIPYHFSWHVPLPLKIGAGYTVVAGLVDINYGAIAGGITVVGGAATLVYWNFAAKRAASIREAEAAKLEAFKASEVAKLEIYRAAEAAKIQVARDAELTKIELQKQQDEANKGSLSEKLTMLSGQLAAIQRSADEANRALCDAREMNKLLRQQLDNMAGRVDDANKKLHDMVNEANAKNLRHEVEKRELLDAKADLLRQLDEIRRATDRVGDTVAKQADVLAPMVPKVADNTARLDDNATRLDDATTRLDDASARLDKIDGGH